MSIRIVSVMVRYLTGFGAGWVRRPCATRLSIAVEARHVRTLSARLVSTGGTRAEDDVGRAALYEAL